jgi:hypothetical protein
LRSLLCFAGPLTEPFLSKSQARRSRRVHIRSTTLMEGWGSFSDDSGDERRKDRSRSPLRRSPSPGGRSTPPNSPSRADSQAAQQGVWPGVSTAVEPESTKMSYWSSAVYNAAADSRTRLPARPVRPVRCELICAGCASECHVSEALIPSARRVGRSTHGNTHKENQ